MWMLLGMCMVCRIFCFSFEYEFILTLLGQLYDVLRLYDLTGPPSEKHYILMNGDLVDRGSWSVEVILLAFAYKCTSAKSPVILAMSIVKFVPDIFY